MGVLGWIPFKNLFKVLSTEINDLSRVVNKIRASFLFLRSAAVSINQNFRTTADISSNVINVPKSHPILL